MADARELLEEINKQIFYFVLHMWLCYIYCFIFLLYMKNSEFVHVKRIVIAMQTTCINTTNTTEKNFNEV